MSDIVERLRTRAEAWMRGDLTDLSPAIERDAADEIERLRAWKREALEVERSWDAQAIAKLLDLKPGDDIRAAIQSEIERLRAWEASLRGVGEILGVTAPDTNVIFGELNRRRVTLRFAEDEE